MVLDDFHKIESRLRCLGKPTTICVLIEGDRGEDDNEFRVSLNLPGVFESWEFHILGGMTLSPSKVSGLSSIRFSALKTYAQFN